MARRRTGSALFLDISGFTPLTNALAEAAGRAAAEEIGTLLNRLYEPLIDEIQRFGGSVVGFAGDAVTGWFDGDTGKAAVRAAIRCQNVLTEIGSVESSAGTRQIEGKVTVTVGAASRSAVGDPDTQLLDALFGAPIDRLGDGDKLASPGEVLIDEAAAGHIDADLITEWRGTGTARFAVIDPSRAPVDVIDPPPEPISPSSEQMRPWTIHRVQELIEAGEGALLSENRPAVSMFMGFDGIDLNSDDALAELDSYIRYVQTVLFQHGGTPLSLSIGDKGAYMLVTFGVPQAHRDDPARALAAAEVLRYPPPDSTVTGVRIGLSSAPLWSGMIGGPRRAFYSVMGDGVNVAARLMTQCDAGEVLLVGDFSSAAGRFEIWPMPAREIKGHPGVTASEMIGIEHDAATRLQDTPFAFPMVARTDEIATVEARLDAATNGEGGLIAVHGEAGIGKSRLANRALELALGKGFRTAGSAGSSYGTATPYLVWHRTLQMLLDIRPSEPPDRQLARLERAVGQMGPEAAVMVPLFGPLLGLAIPDNEHTAPIPAPVRKEIVTGMVLGILGAMSQGQPILIVLDNVQWLDPLSYELLATLAGASTEMPVVVLALHTDNVDHEGLDLGGAPATTIELTGLNDSDMAHLIELKLSELFGLTTAHPEALTELVRSRARGNPLFCEELLRDVSDRGIDPLDPDAPARLELPQSVQRLVLDRLDRLPRFEQAILRHGAALGLRFPYEWLAGSGAGFADLDQLSAALTRLTDEGILELDLDPGRPTYAFASATTRDVTYESVGLGSRREIHEGIAAYLERDVDPAPVQLLAFHFQLARNAPKELQYAGAAGEVALGTAAYTTAREMFERGLVLVRAAGDPALAGAELGLQLGLGAALLTLEGQQSEEAHQCYERAYALTGQAEPGPDAARAMFGLWTHNLFGGSVGRATELAQGLLFGAEMSGQAEAIMQSHLAVSLSVYWLGDLAGTVEHAEKMLELYDPAEASGYVARYAQNPRVTGMTDATWAVWMLGRPADALTMARDTAAHADELGHAFVAVIAAQILPLLHVHMGEVEAAEEAGGAFMAKAQDMGNPVYIGLATVILGWTAGARGEVDQALGMLLGVRAGMAGEGVNLLDPLLVTLAADVCLRNDHSAQGLELLDEYFKQTDLNQHRLYLPEQLRLKAELLARFDGDAAEIEALLTEAGTVASDTGNIAYRIRTLTSRLALVADGRAEVAAQLEDLLAAVIDGDQTPDVIAARARLAEGTP